MNARHSIHLGGDVDMKEMQKRARLFAATLRAGGFRVRAEAHGAFRSLLNRKVVQLNGNDLDLISLLVTPAIIFRSKKFHDAWLGAEPAPSHENGPARIDVVGWKE